MIGKQLGQYEIVEHIGAGGMGEVYRARDAKLDRDVAIKVLPDEFACDPGRLDRFEREAKLLAALQHPNIAVIHGLEEVDGIRFLALELVDGPGLDERLAGGPLPVDQAIDFACQIARALEAAHERGIVHRDLKPANIKLTRAGNVKVLDFGLAKALARDETGSPAAPSGDMTASPTMSEGTRTGVILGTASYMSPEQARGDDIDKRTDIWSFGCVLFEMLSGKRAFPASNVSESIAAILKDEPDWSVLPADVPAHVRRVLFRCLRKDAGRRLHDIADARIALEDPGDATIPGGIDAGAPGAGSRSSGDRSQRLVWGFMAVAAAITAFTVWSSTWQGSTPAPAPAPVRRATITMPDGRTAPRLTAFNIPFALSPDGSMIVYAAVEDGRQRLYARPFDARDARPIEGTEGGFSPFFSPDGEWVGFAADGWVRKVSIDGGIALPLFEVGARFIGATWVSDDAIVFTPDIASGMHRFSSTSGETEPLTQPDRDGGEIGHNWPQAIRGSNMVLFTLQRSDGFDVAILSLADGTWTTVLNDAALARYAVSGHLVYLADELRAVPFDLATRRPTGLPAAIAAVSWFELSADGTLASVSGGSAFGRVSGDLVWVERNGAETVVPGGEGVSGHPVISPDEARVAVEVQTGPTVDIHILDLSSGGRSRFSLDGNINNFPTWSPDGSEIVFDSTRTPNGLYRKRWDASDSARMFLPRSLGVPHFPTSWSAQNGTIVYFEMHPETAEDIWEIRADGGGDPRPLIAGPYRERAAKLSPDGRLIAYMSDETGVNEAYIAAYPDLEGKTAISSGGAAGLLWAPDSSELYYLSDGRMMAARVGPGDIVLGPPVELFASTHLVDLTFRAPNYDVTADGRFLMIRGSAPQPPARAIDVVFNWFEELRRLAPASR